MLVRRDGEAAASQGDGGRTDHARDGVAVGRSGGPY
jgi:hypothetical protein